MQARPKHAAHRAARCQRLAEFRTRGIYLKPWQRQIVASLRVALFAVLCGFWRTPVTN